MTQGGGGSVVHVPTVASAAAPENTADRTKFVPRFLGMGPDATARERAAFWLRQNFPRHASKMLQAEFGLEERTAKRVLAGDVSQGTLERLRRRFGKPFAQFVFLDDLAPPAMAFGEGAPERHLWITEAGESDASDGHDEAARVLLGLLPSRTDHVALALRNYGWVAATVRPGSVALRHGAAPAAQAVRRAIDWLVTFVGVAVEVNGTRHAEVIGAVAALETLLARTHAREAMHAARWQVERRPLDAIMAPTLQAFLRARTQAGDAPGTLPRILVQTGIMADTALLRVAGDNVVSLWAGHRLGVNAALVMGRDLRERPGDPRYPEMVRAHVLQACAEEGPTFHELRGVVIDGKPHNYRRVAAADRPGPNGDRLVAAVVDREAA